MVIKKREEMTPRVAKELKLIICRTLDLDQDPCPAMR